jgi:serine/threonine protein kinase/tetratricopeptide (TPR) repeat protein
MSDPKDPKFDFEAGNLVPGGRAPVRPPAQADQAVKTPVSGSPPPDEVFEAATMLEGALPPMPPSTGQTLPRTGASRVSPAGPSSALGLLVLQPGTVLGNRYEIIQMLGEGGMGAVYKAKDIELGRVIALKVIRPELASDREILRRYKQELILARQITDRNVIRIFDLGEAGGIKFITMEYVEGESLYQILRRQGKVPISEAIDIMRQMLSGLQSAHREGVIHRDLKPGNIMRDAQGRVVVMDFGLARSLEGDGMTRTGTMMGTMEYMSPEQAQAKELDARSDIFTVGLICYELLTGKMPYHADSVVASLLKRMQERAAPPSDWDATIPQPVSELVSMCLERDPAQRWQSAQEIIDRIDEIQGRRPPSMMASRPPISLTSGPVSLSKPPTSLTASSVSTSLVQPAQPRSKRRIWLDVVLVVIAVSAITAVLFNRRQPKATAGSHAPVSVLVADFQNNTSDALFDGTLEPMLNVALEGASFINGYNRGSARQLAEKLPNPTSKLDEQAARLVAVSQGVNAIVTGSLSLRGNAYRLSVEVIDAVTGKILATSDISAANKDNLLLDIPKLAAPIRKALGDTTPASVQLAATQGSFAASNVEAVHLYSIGMEQQFSGKMAEALESFSKAAELDPNFARAYAGMAAAAGNLGQAQNAEKYAKLAIEHVDRMTERERYRVRGQFYIRTENWQKCVDEFGELVKQYPADNIGYSNLVACYARLLNMPKAMEEAKQGSQLAPKDVPALMNYSLYSCYATDFQSCADGAQRVLQINPGYEEAFLVSAYAELGQNQLPQAAETYQKLEKVSPWGASLAASGLGDLALYQGKFREGAEILEKGAAADLAAKKPDAAADKFLMLAYGNLLRNDKASAVTAAGRALVNRQSVKTRFLAARVFVEAGEAARAKKLAESLGSELQAEPQAYAKLILGEAALKERNPRPAIQLFNEAKGLMDTWLTHFDLGRAYLDAGAFTEADSEFDRCISRRGEALELFMDDGPTFSYLPPVYYNQGQDREGLKSPGFADSYRTYLSIRGTSTEDALATELRARLGK